MGTKRAHEYIVQNPWRDGGRYGEESREKERMKKTSSHKYMDAYLAIQTHQHRRIQVNGPGGIPTRDIICAVHFTP